MGSPWRGRRCRSVLAAATLGVGLLALGGCAGDGGGARPTAPGSTSASSSAAGTGDPEVYADELLRETNAARDRAGLPELSGSWCARTAALERSADLVGAATLTHAPLAGVIKDCAPATTAAENLSRASAAPGAVLKAWLGSPGHRSNLLDPALTEIGIGCTPDAAAMLCSQVFLGP